MIASSSAPCPSFYCNVVLFITTTISSQYVLSCICPSCCFCLLVPKCYLIGLAMTVGVKFVYLQPFNHRDVPLVGFPFCLLCLKHGPACVAIFQFLQARRVFAARVVKLFCLWMHLILLVMTVGFRSPLDLASCAASTVGLEGQMLCSAPSIFASLMERLSIQL